MRAPWHTPSCWPVIDSWTLARPSVLPLHTIPPCLVSLERPRCACMYLNVVCEGRTVSGKGTWPGTSRPDRARPFGAAQAQIPLNPQGNPSIWAVDPLKSCCSRPFLFLLPLSLFFPRVSGGSFIPDQRYQTIFLESRSRTPRQRLQSYQNYLHRTPSSTASVPFSFFPFLPNFYFHFAREITIPYSLAPRLALLAFSAQVAYHPSPVPSFGTLSCGHPRGASCPPSVAFVPHIRHRSSQTLFNTSA